jgi:hypothetical protein
MPQPALNKRLHLHSMLWGKVRMFLGRFFFFFIFLFILSHSVFSLDLHGVKLSPIDAEPDKVVVNPYTVTGANHPIEVKVGGELKDYVDVIDKGPYSFDLVITFPSSLPEPGEYGFDLSVVEVPDNVGAGGIGSLVSVNLKFLVRVPPHGKFIEVVVDASNVNEKEPVPLKVTLRSKGQKDISSVGGTLSVYGESNFALATFTVPSAPLKSLEFIEHHFILDTNALPAATYKAEASITYDGKIKNVGNEFRIGDLDVLLVDYMGQWPIGFTEFVATIENNWGNSINNVYGILVLDGKQLLQTPSITLSPWQKAELKGIFEVDLPLGAYHPTLELFYEEQSKIETLSVEIVGALEVVTVDENNSSNLPWIPVILGVVTLLLIISLIILLLKRRKKEGSGDEFASQKADIKSFSKQRHTSSLADVPQHSTAEESTTFVLGDNDEETEEF